MFAFFAISEGKTAIIFNVVFWLLCYSGSFCIEIVTVFHVLKLVLHLLLYKNEIFLSSFLPFV